MPISVTLHCFKAAVWLWFNISIFFSYLEILRGELLSNSIQWISISWFWESCHYQKCLLTMALVFFLTEIIKAITFLYFWRTGKVTSIRFGPDASYLAVGSSDRNLRIFGAPEAASEPWYLELVYRGNSSWIGVSLSSWADDLDFFCNPSMGQISSKLWFCRDVTIWRGSKKSFTVTMLNPVQRRPPR